MLPTLSKPALSFIVICLIWMSTLTDSEEVCVHKKGT